MRLSRSRNGSPGGQARGSVGRRLEDTGEDRRVDANVDPVEKTFAVVRDSDWFVFAENVNGRAWIEGFAEFFGELTMNRIVR